MGHIHIYKLFILNELSVIGAFSAWVYNPEVVGTSAVKKKTGKTKTPKLAIGVQLEIQKEVISTSCESVQSKSQGKY